MLLCCVWPIFEQIITKNKNVVTSPATRFAIVNFFHDRDCSSNLCIPHLILCVDYYSYCSRCDSLEEAVAATDWRMRRCYYYYIGVADHLELIHMCLNIPI